jgi:hypothetical protein
MRHVRRNVWTLFVRTLALMALIVLAAGPARADATKVIVFVAGEPDAALDSLVEERVRDAGATVEIVHGKTTAIADARSAPDVVAQAWVDFTRSDRASLTVLDRRVERGFVRNVSRKDGDEIAREEIGHALQTAVEGLLAGMTIGVTRAELLGPVREKPKPIETPTPTLTLTPPSPSPSPWRARVAASYGLESFGGRTAVHGPGIALDILGRTGDLSLGGRAAGQIRFPAEITAMPFVLRVESWTVGASAIGSLAVGSGFALEAGAGVLAEIVRTIPLSVAPGGTLAADFVRVLPRAHVSAGIAWTAPRIAVHATLDFGANDAFVFLAGGAPQTLFSIDPVRPGLVIEIGLP